MRHWDRYRAWATELWDTERYLSQIECLNWMSRVVLRIGELSVILYQVSKPEKQSDLRYGMLSVGLKIMFMRV